MANINVTIDANRKMSVNSRQYAGVQGDISACTVIIDITAIYDSEHSYRAEWIGCAGTYENTINLTVTTSNSHNTLSLTIPTEISKLGGTAQLYILEEEQTSGEVAKRICSFPLRLYFLNKPTETGSVNVEDATRDMTEMYLFVSNKIGTWEEEIEAAQFTVSSYDLDMSNARVLSLSSNRATQINRADTLSQANSTSISDLETETEKLDNKVTTFSNTSTDTQYPSAKAVYDGLATKLDKSSKLIDRPQFCDAGLNSASVIRIGYYLNNEHTTATITVDSDHLLITDNQYVYFHFINNAWILSIQIDPIDISDTVFPVAVFSCENGEIVNIAPYEDSHYITVEKNISVAFANRYTKTATDNLLANKQDKLPVRYFDGGLKEELQGSSDEHTYKVSVNADDDTIEVNGNTGKIQIAADLISKNTYPTSLNAWVDNRLVDYDTPTVKLNCFVDGVYKDGGSLANYRHSLTPEELATTTRQTLYLVRTATTNTDWYLQIGNLIDGETAPTNCYIPVCSIWCANSKIVDFVPFGSENLKENYFDPSKNDYANSLPKTVTGKELVINNISPRTEKVKISGTASEVVTIKGKNLVKPSYFTGRNVGTFTVTQQTDGSLQIDNTSYPNANIPIYLYIPTEIGKWYNISFETDLDNVLSSNNVYQVAYYTCDTLPTIKTANILISGQLGVTTPYTVKASKAYIGIMIEFLDTANIKLQIEENYEHTEFEAPFEDTVTLDTNGKGEYARKSYLHLTSTNAINVSYNVDNSKASALANKTVYNFGDSIAFGAWGCPYCTQIGIKNSMVVKNYAVSGATVRPTSVTQGSYSIIDQITDAPNDMPDYILINGITNDIQTGTVQGTISTGYDATLDSSTFCGAFENMLKTILTKWVGAKVIYVGTHKDSVKDLTLQSTMTDTTLSICKKWGVPVVDMFYGSTLNSFLSDYSTAYTTEGCHPNTLGYSKFYVPMVEHKMLEVAE